MENKKKEVFIVVNHFLPGTKIGGPLTSLKNIIDYLNEHFKFKVITSDRDLGETLPYADITPNKWTKIANIDVIYLSLGLKFFKRIFLILRNSTVDCIYLPSLFEPRFSIFIILLNKLGLVRTKIVVAPKGELFEEALNFKPFKKQIFINFAKIIGLYKKVIWHATDDKEKNIIIQKMGILPGNIKIANLLSATYKEKYVPTAPLDNDILKIVFLARVSKDKNLPFIFDVLNEVKTTVIFDIFGPIEDVDIWKKCKEKIEFLPQNIRVEYKGILDRKLVSQTLASYDLFFLPTFAENFGHSIVEAISVGTPVLISDNTPWRDLKEKQWGWDIPLSNKQEFVDAIHFISDKSSNEKYCWRKELLESFNKSFSLESIIEQNKNLFN